VFFSMKRGNENCGEAQHLRWLLCCWFDVVCFLGLYVRGGDACERSSCDE
jgi:hypothetical protein